MKYCTDTKRLAIGIYEFILTAKRGISPYLCKDENEPTPPLSLHNENVVFLDFSRSGYSFRLYCDIAASGENMTFPVRSLRGSPDKEEKSLSRGIGYILALMDRCTPTEVEDDKGYRFKIADPEKKSHVCISYVSSRGEIGEVHTETVGVNKLLSFFEKCAEALPDHAKAEIERVTVRMPSMKDAKFPYREMRDGQKDFIKAAYRTIAKGGELFAIAPTGTGKTVSALFPAIRAIGDGRADKAFYLTPKTTTAKAAKECLELFSENGVKVRGIVLSAKERLCQRRLSCRDGYNLCPTLEKNSMTKAVLELFSKNLAVVDRDSLLAVAEAYTVCPYELALSYSELCDVIICDFNYLFDTRVYIRRFFSNGGNFAFLIDESHNLADRAREMYSAKISKSDIDSILNDELIAEASAVRAAARELSASFQSILFPIIKDELREDKDGAKSGAYHSKSLPQELYSAFLKAKEATEAELTSSCRAKDEENGRRARRIKDYIYILDSFLGAMERFDEHYELFLFYENGMLSAEIFCLDTGVAIRQRLNLGRSAVFFSGTLSPIEYYKEILGADNSSGVLNVESPFAPEQLSVSVISHVSTRFNQRDDTLFSICRYIAATLSAKRGNYMIFSPSFAYCEKLYSAFTAKYPKIRAILQKPEMTSEQKRDFLAEFEKNDGTYLAAFCVTGGIYSEGIDLTGDKLIGAVIVGVGLPTPSFEREAISAYYDEKSENGKLYSYIYPGMNKVLQAAGRVIRCEEDRGVIVLIDDRFDDPIYKSCAPYLWRDMKYFTDPKALNEHIKSFWEN